MDEHPASPSPSSPSRRWWWFLLIDSTGHPYKQTTADYISLSPATVDLVVVAQLKKLVKKEHAVKLSHIDAADLRVFKNKESFDNHHQPLDEDDTIADFGRSKKDALVVVVPNSPEERPTKRIKSADHEHQEVPKWINEVPVEYSVEMGNLFFVNRKTAVLQLQQIHQHNYIKAVKGFGEDWKIPLVDNIFGLGKTSFGCHYIRQCGIHNNEDVDQDFLATVRRSRTVSIRLSRGVFSSRDNAEPIMIQLLMESLSAMFINPPSILLEPRDSPDYPLTAEHLLLQVTKQVGPLFIILDEIGSAFECLGLTDLEKRENFIRFCVEVLGKWFQKNIFFLLLGRGTFLSYVGDRPSEEPLLKTASPFIFKRLSIHLLRADRIAEILKNTTKSGVSLDKYYNLEQEEVDGFARFLYHQTNGHPRRLLTAFRECRTLDELKQIEQDVGVRDWNSLATYCLTNKAAVNRLLMALDSQKGFNLSQVIIGSGRRLTYDIIASNLSLSWEGEMEKAILYAPPFLVEFLRQAFLPLQAYLTKIKSITKVSINYPTVFEWMIIKRFQEMFSKSCRAKAASDFFNTLFFGKLSFALSSEFRAMPKVTENGNRSAGLDSLTAHPDCLGGLLVELDQYASICAKPLPQSSSSDALFVTNVSESEQRLSLGIAIKNLSSAGFSNEQLMNECTLFERMFVETVEKTRINVLIVCATKYSQELSSRFGDKKVFFFTDKKKYPHVDEIVVLNLSTRENRTRFFGLPGDHDLGNTIESVIGKVEMEYRYSNGE